MKWPPCSWVVVATGLFALGGSTAVATLQSEAQRMPEIHDEYSYLLATDTFLEGRLANPTHRFPAFFETFHVIQRPTYASKYPPANGASLALGSIVGGSPEWGVRLTMALACSALAWMFFGWLPSRWATLLSALMVLQIGVVGYWNHSFWGGGIPALAGALLFGALPRIRQGPSFSSGVLAGVAVVLLANSRPFEGLLAVIVALSFFGWTWFHADAFWRNAATRKVVLPIGVLSSVAVLSVAAYNSEVTKDPFTLPYQVHERQYSSYSNFIFLTPNRPKPAYKHDAMRSMHEYYAERQERLRHPKFFLEVRGQRVAGILTYLLGPLVVGVAGLLVGAPRGGHRELRFLSGASILVICVSSFTLVMWPHYVAVVTGALWVLAGAGLRRLHQRIRYGTALVGLFGLITIGATGHRIVDSVTDAPTHFQQQRFDITSALNESAGSDLVFVEYGPDHEFHQEWVYNRADIDGASIIWARSMSLEKNRGLIDHYPNRVAWRLFVDQGSRVVDLRRLE